MGSHQSHLGDFSFNWFLDVFGGLGQPIPQEPPIANPLIMRCCRNRSTQLCSKQLSRWLQFHSWVESTVPARMLYVRYDFMSMSRFSYSFYQLPHLASTLIFDMLSNPIENVGWCANIVATSQSERCFCFLLSKVTRAWMDSPAIRELQHASIVAVEARQRQETPAAPNVACLERRARGR